jgi:hypothetical protein
MKKRFLPLLFLFQICNLYGQQEGVKNYREGCLYINNIAGKGKDVLDVEAGKMLAPGEIYVYFHLEKEDSIRIELNDSTLIEKFITFPEGRSGDIPDFSIKVVRAKKKNNILLFFKKDKVFVKIPVKKRYQVYQVSSWQNCIYVTMKKYYRFN